MGGTGSTRRGFIGGAAAVAASVGPAALGTRAVAAPGAVRGAGPAGGASPCWAGAWPG
ncbi:hypothetical protein ACR820_28870 [Streptomyces netropsis]